MNSLIFMTIFIDKPLQVLFKIPCLSKVLNGNCYKMISFTGNVWHSNLSILTFLSPNLQTQTQNLNYQSWSDIKILCIRFLTFHSSSEFQMETYLDCEDDDQPRGGCDGPRPGLALILIFWILSWSINVIKVEEY